MTWSRLGRNTMTDTLVKLEARRSALQTRLDAQKTRGERNRLGQFATPYELAVDILRCAVGLLPAGQDIHFLDPAVGTGVFFSALRRVVGEARVQEALGIEADPHYGKPAADLWKAAGLSYKIGDFTHEPCSPRFNLVVCNPPYVRHHHLERGDKARLQASTLAASGMKLTGLSGLYCHFLGLSHAWMAGEGIAAWLMPSELMDVSYGQAVKRYLLQDVTLLHVHRFDPDDVQFADALVSSAVVLFRKAVAPKDHAVRFTSGGSLSGPKLTRQVPAGALMQESKWGRLRVGGTRGRQSSVTIGDFFHITRGLATGDNRFFILTREAIAERGLPVSVFRPILPSPRYLKQNRVATDAQGLPDLDRQLFLLDVRLTEAQIRRRHPRLSAYLEEGRAQGLPERYLCQHRNPWYLQEDRPAPPILCTYMGRSDGAGKKPFRFILNLSRATAANVYLLLYPTPMLAAMLKQQPALIERVWEALSSIHAAELLGQGRVYGGGLHKLEPRELAQVPVPHLAGLVPCVARQLDLDLASFEESGPDRRV